MNEAPPAGGAALDQVVIATAGGALITTLVLLLCMGHRSGRIGLLAYGDRLSTRYGGIPGWAGVPSAIALAVLPTTLFGLQWDESLHMAKGRDEGPLANPSHYFLLIGIFAAFAAGVIGMALGDKRVPASGIRIADGWRAPIGAVLTAAGAAVALLGFPLDDVWHRLFGQDVTLWSPTHVTMIVGMALSVVGLVVLNVEGMRARGPGRGSLTAGVARLAQRVMLPAALLLVLSLLQGEFDFGVPQFQLIFGPMTIMVAAGMALVAARIFIGPGGAIGAAVAFVAIRGVITLLVGPVLGEPVHVFPLYVVEALIVEAVAFRVSPRDAALRFGVVCGALIGTVGLAAEWAWSSAVYPIAWPSELLPEGAVLGFAMAMAGSLVGAWMGSHLRVEGFPGHRPLRHAAVGGALVIAVLLGYGLVLSDPAPVRAAVTLTPAGEGRVDATVRLDPPDAAEGATWFRTIAWQGGGLEGADLRRVSEGVYETTKSLPVTGNWKTAVRLHTGRSLSGLPIFLPDDPAIPVKEVPASPSFERAFTNEKTILQREAKDVAGWLWTGSIILVALAMAGLMAAWAAAMHRLAVSAGADRAPDERPQRSEELVGAGR